MLTPYELKQTYESKFKDLSAEDCVKLCMESVRQPLEGIKPRDPVMKYIYESAKVVKLVNPTPEYYVSKEYRKELVGELTEAAKFHDYEVERDISPSLKDIVRNQYNKLRSESKSFDSALMGGSVIVPYSGVIRKPRTDEEQTEHIRILRTVKKKTPKEIKEAIECKPFEFMSGLDLNDRDEVSEVTTISRYISTESASLILSAIESNSIFLDLVEASESTITDDTIMKLGKDLDTSDLLAAESLQHNNLDKLRNLVARADVLDSSTDQSSNFNVQILIDFIIQHDHFVRNELADSIFLSENTRELTDVFYYGDTILCEIEDKYLATPVMDVSDGNIPKIICIDREGNITVAKV